MQFAFLNSNKYAAINALKASIAVIIAPIFRSWAGQCF